MSKLIEELKAATIGSPQPMGFKSARLVPARPRLLIVASLSEVKAVHLAGYASGASALLVASGLRSQHLKMVAEAAADIPWGCSLGNDQADKLPPVIKAGGDFVTFPASTPLKTLPDSQIGRILEVDAEAAEKLPRAINNSPVDAVYLVTATGDESLTWHHLLLVRSLTGLLTKPLLVSIPDTVTEGELQAFWDAGVAGIVAVARPTGNIDNLRQIIDRLNYPTRHSSEKQDAVLPFTAPSQGATVTETKEDEEEDW